MSDARVVGCKVSFSSYNSESDAAGSEGEHKIDIDELLTRLAHFPLLNNIFLSFENYDDLVATMRRYRPTSFNHTLSNHRYILAYMRSDDDEGSLENSGEEEYFGVDPITLAPTGMSSVRTGFIVLYTHSYGQVVVGRITRFSLDRCCTESVTSAPSFTSILNLYRHHTF